MNSLNHGERTVIASGKYLQLIQDGGWEFAERKRTSGVVAVVALTEAGELVLTEQYRPPVKRSVIDVPAGLAGDVPEHEAELLAAAAKRELAEETGYRASRLEFLAETPTSPGLSDEVVTFFRASGLRREHGGGGGANENIRVHQVPLDNMQRWLADQRAEERMIDLKVYAALYFATAQETQ